MTFITVHVCIVEDVCPEASFKHEKCSTNITTLLVERLRLLTTLNVSGYNITDQGAAMIGTILLETVSLAKLDLSNTWLNSVKANTIISALKNISSLKVLNISYSNIDDSVVNRLTAVILNNSTIEIINLSHNKLTYNGILKIVILLSSSIKVVDISSNAISCVSITDLATALSKCPVLQELNISQNLLSLTNILTVVQCFRNHPALQTLDLSSNNVSFPSACEFIMDVILSVNQKLVNFKVYDKNIRPRCIDHYLSAPRADINSTTLTLQGFYSLQHSSLDIQTRFFKVTETCPVASNDIISYYVDHHGGEFYNQYHNFAIVIPPGAVAQGDCVEIQATANYFGPYIIPDGFYPISSYYWVSANYQFKSPVYFTMYHYGRIRSIEDLSNLYVLHKCTQDAAVMNNDLLMSTISDGVYFDNEIGYCVLATNHFCSYCQAKDVRDIPEYLTACYCTFDEPSSGSLIAEVCFCPSSSECIKVTFLYYSNIEVYHCVWYSA